MLKIFRYYIRTKKYVLNKNKMGKKGTTKMLEILIYSGVFSRKNLRIGSGATRPKQ